MTFSGCVDLPALLREQSALAEACLIFVHSLRGGCEDLTIIALGKFGGREMSYGADLDVVFVGENIRATQELLVEMGKSTARRIDRAARCAAAAGWRERAAHVFVESVRTLLLDARAAVGNPGADACARDLRDARRRVHRSSRKMPGALPVSELICFR